MRISAALVLLVALLTGCSTKVTYKPKLEAGPAKSSTDIMCVYLKDAEIPRPFEVIGLVHVGDSGITAAWEGTLDKVLNKLMVTAREKGADGVQIIALRAPGDFSSIFRVKANLIRFTDKWEMSGMSETDFLVYLEQNQKTIEPIEGVWTYNGSQPLRVAIKKDSTRPGRDYAGFVLPNTNVSRQAENCLISPGSHTLARTPVLSTILISLRRTRRLFSMKAQCFRFPSTQFTEMTYSPL